MNKYKNVDNTTMGGRIRMLRLDKELSEEELYDKLAELGVVTSDSSKTKLTTIRRCETNANQKGLSSEIIKALAKVFDVSTDYLIFGDDEPKNKDMKYICKITGLSPQAVEWLSFLKDTPEWKTQKRIKSERHAILNSQYETIMSIMSILIESDNKDVPWDNDKTLLTKLMNAIYTYITFTGIRADDFLTRYPEKKAGEEHAHSVYRKVPEAIRNLDPDSIPLMYKSKDSDDQNHGYLKITDDEIRQAQITIIKDCLDKIFKRLHPEPEQPKKRKSK